MREEQLVIGAAGEIIAQAGEEKYQDFVDKFREPKTTDDCYTPPEIHEAVEAWVEKTYGVRREDMARPFWPGADYKETEYPEGCCVVDNPPFSILAQIVDWYLRHGVKFFLYAPTLTVMGILRTPRRKAGCCVILCGCEIVYENGAVVQTSFVTNLDPDYNLRIEADIKAEIDAISERLRKEGKKELPKYAYPYEVVSGKDYRLAKYGQTLRVRREECASVSALDAQRESGKSIFGSGLLLSERAAAERASAERAAAERAAAERASATTWQLSDREREIVRKLGQEKQGG